MTPLPSDDIPEALRDARTTPSSSANSSFPQPSAQRTFPIVGVVIIGVGAIALGATTAIFWQPIMRVVSELNLDALPPMAQRPVETSGVSSAEAEPVSNANSDDENSDDKNSDDKNSDDENNAASTALSAGSLLGHRPYEEAPEESLVPVVGDASIRLRASAAEHFAEMVQAARAAGIRLRPLSGFRTEDEQSYLFFQIKEDRKQDSSERATVSAPPGYSEHHTGYAIDIGDATQPGTNLSESFAETAAFQWLEENATAYSFELSFEGQADSTVSYEPWHWRFVGDRHSLETFYGENTDIIQKDRSGSETGAEAGDKASSDEQPSTNGLEQNNREQNNREQNNREQNNREQNNRERNNREQKPLTDIQFGQ